MLGNCIINIFFRYALNTSSFTFSLCCGTNPDIGKKLSINRMLWHFSFGEMWNSLCQHADTFLFKKYDFFCDSTLNFFLKNFEVIVTARWRLYFQEMWNLLWQHAELFFKRNLKVIVTAADGFPFKKCDFFCDSTLNFSFKEMWISLWSTLTPFFKRNVKFFVTARWTFLLKKL
jgi:hypothetical protein